MSDLASLHALSRTSAQLPIDWYFDPQVYALEQRLRPVQALHMLGAARRKGLADLFRESEPPGTDLVARVLPVVDQRFRQHIHAARRGGDRGKPLVVDPFLRERQRRREQGATENGGGAGDNIAPQQHVECPAFGDGRQLARPDLERVEQRHAQRRELRIDQARVGVQQQQICGLRMRLSRRTLRQRRG